MLQIKKVFCSLLDVQGDRTFESILLNNDLKGVLPFKGKSLELSHVVDEGNYITGMFVATQTKDIAPLHKPGDDNDYSAVSMGDGQGFAFPNVFIYIKALNALVWEVNRMGVVESGMEYYFNTVSSMYANNLFHVNLLPIMNIEASTRLDRMIEMNEIEFQIAEPTRFLRAEAGAEGTMSDLSKVVSKLNATKCITIKLTAYDNAIDKLDKKSVWEIVRSFMHIPDGVHGHTKNKLVVIGKSGDDDNLIEETINFVTDRLKSLFKINKVTIASDLQIDERKESIRTVAITLYNQIKELI